MTARSKSHCSPGPQHNPPVSGAGHDGGGKRESLGLQEKKETEREACGHSHSTYPGHSEAHRNTSGSYRKSLGLTLGLTGAPAQAYSTLVFFPCFRGAVEPERGTTQDLRGKEERAGIWGTDSQSRVQQARAL